MMAESKTRNTLTLSLEPAKIVVTCYDHASHKLRLFRYRLPTAFTEVAADDYPLSLEDTSSCTPNEVDTGNVAE